MKIAIQFLLILLVTQTAVWGQSSIITGKVRDSINNTFITEADIFLLKTESHKAVLHVRSDANGFVMQRVPSGKFRLVTTAPGYDNDTLLLTIGNKDSLQLNIALKTSANELDGVIVKSNPKPVSIKGDTVIFHADAYTVRPNAQLEDLLRKLPGIDVDKEGNITMQGQKIDKVTVNGKDFFLGDTKQANSLPSEMISSIETYSTQSERAQFSGVREQSSTKTLNIKTKKDMDKVVFGNAYASKGQGDSYAAGGKISRLTGDHALLGGIKLNNINNRFMGVDEKSTGPQSGIQSTAEFNMVVREQWGKKLAAGFTFNNTNQTIDILQTTNRRTFFSDSSLQESRLGQGLNKTSNYPANFALTYYADSMNHLQLTASLNVSNSSNSNQDTASIQTLLNGGGNYLSSRTKTDNTTRQNSLNFHSQLEWRHRFAKAGRTLQWGITRSVENSSSPGSLYSELNSFDKNGSLQQHTLINQRYTQRTDGNSYGTTVMYTEPVAKDQNISLTYTFNTRFQESDRKSNDFDSVSGDYNKPNTVTTNHFNNRNTSHKVEGSYGVTKKKVNYTLGLGWLYSILDNKNISPERHIRQNFTNIFPRASVNFLFAKGKYLSLNYDGMSIAPTIEQLQPLPDLSNPLFISTGNPDLKQSFNHSVNINLNSYSSKTFSGIMVSLTGDLLQNQIVASTTLKPGGVQEQQFMNVNGTYHLGSMGSYSFRLSNSKNKGIRNSGSISSRLRYGHEAGMINGMENISRSIAWEQTFKLNYSVGTKFISELLSGLGYSDYRYSISPEQNTKSWSQSATLNVSYELPLGINIQGTYSWMHQGTSGLLPPQSASVLNAAIFKRLFEKQQWQIRLSCFDLLNSNRNYMQSATANYIYTRQTNQLQRMFLLSLVYDFRVFPNRKKESNPPLVSLYGVVPHNR